MIDNIKSGHGPNLLASITPTFPDAWTTEPDTNADMTHEITDTALTTFGVSKALSSVQWDLGNIGRRITFVDNELATMVTWTSQLGAGDWKRADLWSVSMFISTFRYIRMNQTGVDTVRFLNYMVYDW